MNRVSTRKHHGRGELFAYVPVKPDEKSLLFIRGYFSGDRAVCAVTPGAGSWIETDAIGFFCLPEPILSP